MPNLGCDVITDYKNKSNSQTFWARHLEFKGEIRLRCMLSLFKIYQLPAESTQLSSLKIPFPVSQLPSNFIIVYTKLR
jgi:hypothetical protein